MVSLPLKDMTMEEKLEAMEQLWQELCSQAGQVPSPGWHKDTLEEREAALAHGGETPEDWPAARRRIEKEIE